MRQLPVYQYKKHVIYDEELTCLTQEIEVI